MVDLTLSVKNTSTVPQTFTLETTLPTGAFTGNRMGGSVGGDLRDAGGNGAQVTSAALYTALIDGANVQQLHPGLNVTVVQPFLGTPIPQASFGNPIPSAPAPDVVDNIGIRLSFRLSPGDLIALTSVFVVQTPEPGIAALLGGAGLLLAVLRSRRTRS